MARPKAGEENAMLVDKCCCLRCNSIYELEFAVEAGTKLQCDDCGRVITAGRVFEGENHEGALIRAFRPPPCPGCGSSDSVMGKKIGISPSTFIRQCNKCHSVWRGTAWYFEGQIK